MASQAGTYSISVKLYNGYGTANFAFNVLVIYIPLPSTNSINSTTITGASNFTNSSTTNDSLSTDPPPLNFGISIGSSNIP